MIKPIYEEVTGLTGATSIKRMDPDGTIWWIPTDPDNSDYQTYLKSLENAE